MGSLRTILHVDDDPDIRELARMSLELIGGFDVHQCSSARAALEALGQMRPDLILLDVMMPELDGPSLVAQMRGTEDLRDLPVVYMTAKSDASATSALDGPGVIGVVTKPFDPMTLPEQLKRFWQKVV